MFYENEAWKKKDTDTTFDVTLGSYNGAALCELIEIYIQSHVTNMLYGFIQRQCAIYPSYDKQKEADRRRKEIISIFKCIDFKTEIDTSLTEAEVAFNLENNIYRPYKKLNDKLIYIDVSSNHPAQIRKTAKKNNLCRLSRNFSRAYIFNITKLEYEKAMKKCRHTTKLTYTPRNLIKNNSRRKWQCKIIWFKPLFNLDVSTNVAKIFLSLIEKGFLHSSKLHKTFDKNTIN